MPKITDIEGIGPAYAQKLAKAGVRTTDALLKKGSTPAGRRELEQATGLPRKLILQWVLRVDMLRIKGLGSSYADLLEMAGVDSMRELSKRDPFNLHRRLLEMNSMRRITPRSPSPQMVHNWIGQANSMAGDITIEGPGPED